MLGLPGGLNGRQLAEVARERHPSMPVLFITGYAGSVLKGQLAPSMGVIGNPFTLAALGARVRAMVEGRDRLDPDTPERAGLEGSSG